MATRTAIIRADGEGEAVWFNNDLFTFKATADETDNAFTLFEEISQRGKVTPLHLQLGDFLTRGFRLGPQTCVEVASRVHMPAQTQKQNSRNYANGSRQHQEAPMGLCRISCKIKSNSHSLLIPVTSKM